MEESEERANVSLVAPAERKRRHWSHFLSANHAETDNICEGLRRMERGLRGIGNRPREYHFIMLPEIRRDIGTLSDSRQSLVQAQTLAPCTHRRCSASVARCPTVAKVSRRHGPWLLVRTNGAPQAPHVVRQSPKSRAGTDLGSLYAQKTAVGHTAVSSSF